MHRIRFVLVLFQLSEIVLFSKVWAKNVQKKYK